MDEMRTYWIWDRWFYGAEWLKDIEREYDAIEAAGQADSGSGDAERITPDPAGEDVTADDGRPVDEVRVAWNYVHIMRRLYGTYSDKAHRAWMVFHNLYMAQKASLALS